MTTNNNNNDNNGNNDNSKNSDHWLGFSLSPHSSSSSSSNPTTFFTLPSHFNYQNVYYGGVENAGIYSAFPIMPLKSDGSLCLMDAITRSQSQSQGIVASTTPKLENFFGGVTMGTPDLDTSTMYYHQNLDHEAFNHNNRHQNYQIQPQNYQDFSGLYQTVQQDEAKISANGSCGLYLPTIGESWISMSPGCLQSSSSCVTGSQQQMSENVVVDTKKRGAEKVDQNKQIVHRKSLDTFGQRTSQYRGVTRHRWTGRYEAHLWDNSCKKEGQTRKGRQVYLGGYDMEEKAARAYDLAALKYWGPSTHINFPLENYEQELEEMKNMSRQEYVAHLRRRSSGFSRGASVYRGVTRHHQHGRWQARIGRVAGNKDLYLGTFSTQEDAAEAYDVAAIKFRGVNAVTNFDISRYNVEKIMASSTLLAGELARRTKEVDLTSKVLPNQAHNNTEPKTMLNEPVSNTSMLDWRMELYNQNHSGTTVEREESSHVSKSSGGCSPSKNNNNLPMVLITPLLSDFSTAGTQVRSHVPVFAAWSDA